MDPLLNPFLQYGAIGAFLAVMIALAYQLIKREQVRADALAAEVQRLNNVMMEKTVPALVEATKAVTAAQSILQSIQYQKDIEAAATAKAKTP